MSLSKFALSSRRRFADMDVRAGRRSRHRAPERNKWNAGLAQIIQQRLAFGAVWMKRHVHGISVIETQTVVSRGLTESADRQRAVKGIEKEFLNLRREGKRPECAAVVA